MSNEITSTHELAEAEWDGDGPSEVVTDMVATKEPEGKGIEFHVSMRDYTMRDMEELIIEAAARQIVGHNRDASLSKAIEERCITLITEKADKALASVTAEIIDQPMTPKYSFMKDKKPVTMREFIGLAGREYLETAVDSSGKPTTDRYYGRRRIEHIAEGLISREFQNEIKQATHAAIKEISAEVRARHEEFLAAERKRFADALAKTTAA